MTKASLFSLFASVAALSALSVVPVHAQDTFPQREVTIVVPFNPGGASDMTARIIAKGMEADLGRPVIVINKAGGSGGARSRRTAGRRS